MARSIPHAQSFIDVGPDRINRINDRYIKYLFGKAEHHDLLLDFINDTVFPDGKGRFTRLLHTSSELAPEGIGHKLCRLDLSAELDDGITVDIEIQILNEHDFRKRAPYYWSMRHSRKLKKGVDYTRITSTIVICVLAFTLLQDEEPYRNVYGIANLQSGRTLCDDMRIIYLELDKFQEEAPLPRQTGLHRWLIYLSNVEGERMKEIAEMDNEIAQALELEKRYWSDEEERFHYFAEQKRLIDALSVEAVQIQRIEDARVEGRAEGIARGKREEALVIARKLLSRGWRDVEICDITGLSPDDVAQLRGRGTSRS